MQVALLINCGGMLVAYLVVIRDLIHSACERHAGDVLDAGVLGASMWSVESGVMLVVVAGVLAPLVAFRYGLCVYV